MYSHDGENVVHLTDESWVVIYHEQILYVSPGTFTTFFQKKYNTLHKVCKTNPYNAKQTYMVPRRVEFYSLDLDQLPLYTYAKETIDAQTIPDDDGFMGQCLSTITQWIQKEDATFYTTPNTVVGILVNYYTADDHISAHADNEACIIKGAPIYSVSIGDERNLYIYRYNETKIFKKIPCNDGCMLKMDGSMQSEFKHSVKKGKSARINFTVRKYQSNNIKYI